MERARPRGCAPFAWNGRPAARAPGVSPRLAALGMACTLALNTLSAWIRHARAGLGCQPWPSCYGEPVPLTPPGWATAAHRVLALTLLALAVWAAVRTWRQRTGRAAAGVALGAVVGLAAIGPLSGDLGREAVTLANLLGGWVLLGALAWLAAPTGRGPARPAALLFAGLAFLLAANGGLISARFAVDACPALPLCPAPDPGAALHLAHRAAAIALLAALAWWARGLARSGASAAALAAGAVAAAQLLTGALAATGAPGPALAAAHGVGGQLLFAAALALRRS